MQCPKCSAALPEAAHFCHVCGVDLMATDGNRRRHFAVKPDEPVVSFALVSTIMPRGASERPQTYRVALLVVLTAALASAIFGALPIAVLLAAFAIPIVYIVYVYDVNLWEDEPVPVTVLAFLLSLVLGLGWTWAWIAMRDAAEPTLGVGVGLETSFSWTGLLITALLAPVVGEILRQVGPVFLASRPKYDDLMDGLTFGIISGVAFAAADTLVKQWPLITAGFVGPQDPGLWASLMFSEGFIKPLVIGTATGLACAEFSGLGEGYDGFSGRYFVRVLEAIGYNALYFGGVFALSFLADPLLAVLLSIAWGLVLLAVLVLRVRTVLHTGLLEAALEHHARAAGVGEEGRLDFCPACELPLLPDSEFCSACGAAARTASKAHVTAPAGPLPAAPTAEEEESK